jgi:hypothetical protein
MQRPSSAPFLPKVSPGPPLLHETARARRTARDRERAADFDVGECLQRVDAGTRRRSTATPQRTLAVGVPCGKRRDARGVATGNRTVAASKPSERGPKVNDATIRTGAGGGADPHFVPPSGALYPAPTIVSLTLERITTSAPPCASPGCVVERSRSAKRSEPPGRSCVNQSPGCSSSKARRPQKEWREGSPYSSERFC